MPFGSTDEFERLVGHLGAVDLEVREVEADLDVVPHLRREGHRPGGERHLPRHLGREVVRGARVVEVRARVGRPDVARDVLVRQQNEHTLGLLRVVLRRPELVLGLLAGAGDLVVQPPELELVPCAHVRRGACRGRRSACRTSPATSVSTRRSSSLRRRCCPTCRTRPAGRGRARTRARTRRHRRSRARSCSRRSSSSCCRSAHPGNRAARRRRARPESRGSTRTSGATRSRSCPARRRRLPRPSRRGSTGSGRCTRPAR